MAEIKIGDIYNHNVNFLIGSGASVGLLPTLTLKIRDFLDEDYTIETLAKELEDTAKHDLYTLLFMYYYRECIKPGIKLDIDNLTDDQNTVLKNYERFLRTVIQMMNRRPTSEARSCNIFTTNYDPCFEFVADLLLTETKLDFIFNDGCRGFLKRHLHSKNFNAYSYQSGILGKYKTYIPQVNLIHLHGSIYWRNDNEKILVDYRDDKDSILIDDAIADNIGNFSEILKDEAGSLEGFKAEIDNAQIDEFWAAYKKLPIVNPTKYKFYETVFEEHYYQMLRYLSYELEKENSVLIVYGFSFADEHILHLVQRSLSNPKLKVYLCCFSENSAKSMKEKFAEYHNIDIIYLEDKKMFFSVFNDEVFSLDTVKGVF